VTALATAAVPALALVALAEFLLVRVALRLGPAFPPGRGIDAGFDLALWLGLWLMNLAGALAIVVVVLQVARTWRRQDYTLASGTAAAGAAMAVVLVAWVLSVAQRSSTTVLLVQVAAIAGSAVVMAAASPWPGWRRLWLLALAAAYVAAAGHYVARMLAVPWAPAGAITLAEMLALSVATLAPAVWRVGWQPRAAAFALAALLLWGGFAAGQPHIARFLVIWDLGLSSPLPWWAFAVALVGLTYSVAGTRWHPEALGFALIALAGFKVDNTYFGLLALAGIAVMASSVRPANVAALRVGTVTRTRLMPEASSP
jgi:hypothetical protein